MVTTLSPFPLSRVNPSPTPTNQVPLWTDYPKAIEDVKMIAKAVRINFFM
jgi:hypothetical protein